MSNVTSFINDQQGAPQQHQVEDVYGLLLQNIEDHFFLIDPQFRILLVGESTRSMVKKVLGINLQKGTPVLALTPESRHPMIRKVLQEVLQGATRVTQIDLEIDNRTHTFENTFKPAKDGKDNIVGILISTRDITERKIADSEQRIARESMALSEEHYRNLFQNNPLPCWIYERSTNRFLEVNEAALQHYGFSRNELLRADLFLIHPPEQQQKLRDRLEKEKMLDRLSINNWQHQLKNGTIIYVDLRINKILYHGYDAMLVVAHDVTSKVLTENELRASNERFSLTSRASSEALWEWDFTTKKAYISEAYTKILGWNTENFRVFDEWKDYIHPEDRKVTLDSYNNALTDPANEVWEEEYRYLKADGSYAYVVDRALFLRNEAGEPLKVIGAMRNITAQKEVEEDLRRSNERFVLASQAASDAIYDWQTDSDQIYWGDAIQTLFGYHPQELGLNAWELLIHPSERQRIMDSLRDTLEHPHKNIWKQEYRLRKADGSYSFVLERGFIVRSEEGKAIRMIGSLQDISERKFQEQLLSLERYIFELSANPELELKQIIDPLLLGIEELYEGALTSIVQLKNDTYMETLSAPNLPRGFSDVVNGTPIGPEAGSCGTAMFEKQTVIVPDIDTDPLWKDFREEAKRYGLKACWSQPIILSSGKVMGSFAIYYRQHKSPNSMELATIGRFLNIIRIIMENRWSLQQIKLANERFDIMMEATHDLIWDWDLTNGSMYRDQKGLKRVYGIEDSSLIEDATDWARRIHPEDRSRVTRIINGVLQSATRNHFEIEYRFLRDDGTYAHVYDRGVIIHDQKGNPLRMIGAAQDISERKRLETELLASELAHKKAINEATVQSQEQERTEIGKELHDNVNQVLTTTKLYLELANSNPELRDGLINKSVLNIVKVINEIRQLSRSLMDPSIGDLGLIDSINDLIENINLTRKLQVALVASYELEEAMDKNQKLTIFRIIQEALNNAIRHSRASRVMITMSCSATVAEVLIEDDGIGFDINRVKKGAGLKNIQNRIYLINGTHTIESIPNQGSKIRINFPVNQTTTEQPT